MKHSFSIGDRVRHNDNNLEGVVIALTTLEEVVEGDCEDDEKDDPWYDVKWDHCRFNGLEFEGSLSKV